MSLQLDNVTYRIGDKTLLGKVSLTFAPASITVLVGSNGAGKTTLLRVASGELEADSGRVTLDQVVVSDIPLEQRARRVAFLTQQSALDFPFKGYEVMQMGRIPHLTGTTHDRQVVDEVVDICDLLELAERTYTTLSGGEKQRLQIGRILCQVWDQLDSAYVLFDEPTSALDLSHQLTFFEIARKLAAGGASIVLVLHDVNLATRFADNIVLLADGHVLGSGPPREVITRENIRQAFAVEIDLIATDDPNRPLIQARAPLLENRHGPLAF